MKTESIDHPNISLSRIKKDEADRQSLVQLMETSWLNPFKIENDEFVSLSSPTVAPSDIAKDLLDAHRFGEEAYQTFKRERLETDAPSIKFHDKITKLKLKTFTNFTKKKRTQGHAKEILKAERNLFAHIILVAESRRLHMK